MNFELSVDFIYNPLPKKFTVHPYDCDGVIFNFTEETIEHQKILCLSNFFNDALYIKYQECNTGGETTEFLLSNIHFTGNKAFFAKWYKEHLANTEVGKALVESRQNEDDVHEPYPWETRTDTALRFSKLFKPTFEQTHFITELKRTIARKLLDEPICMFRKKYGDVELLHHIDHPTTIVWDDIFCASERLKFYDLIVRSYQLKGEVLNMFD